MALQRLLLPGLYGGAMLLVLGWAYGWLERSGLPTPVALAADVLLTALASVTQVVTVVILTRANREAWPQAAASAQAEAASQSAT